MKTKIVIVSLLVFMCFSCMHLTKVYASDFWQQANDWYDQGVNEYNMSTSIDNLAEENDVIKKVIDDFENMVNVLGTTVIVCVTTFLGIKYMFGTADAKSDVKESMLTLVVACIFFFGWNGIWNLIFQNERLVFNTGGWQDITANIFQTVSFVANILAVAAVIFMGVKYIFAGAKGKAELKDKSWQFLLGVVLAFCSVGFLNYINAIVQELF